MRGHILFPSAEKGCKNATGVPPDPRCQPVFFSGKPAITFFPGTDAHRTRGPEALGDRLGAGLKKCSNPKPRGRSPFFVYRRVRTSAFPPAFLKRTPDRPLKGSLHRQALGPATAIVESRNGPKNQSIRGAKWLPLGTSSPSFFVRGKKVADRPNRKRRVLRYVRAYRAESG